MKILNRIFPEMKVESKPLKMPITKEEPLTAYSLEESKIKEIFDKHGATMTPEKLEEIQIFLKDTEGDLESKLATVELAVEKDVPITSDNLSRIHTAVHEPLSMPDQEIELPEIKKILAMLPKELREALKGEVTKDMPIEKVLLNYLKSQLTTIFTGETEVAQRLTLSPSIAPETSTFIDVPSKDEGTSSLEQVVATDIEIEKNENTQVRDVERFESDAIEHILLGFEQLSEQLDELAEAIMPMITSNILTEPMPVQKVMEIEVTQKMVEAKAVFEMYQKAITAQLEKAIEVPENKIELKEVLASVIDKLDHVLMKSDITLYTDMKTERDLLASSGQLEKARSLIGVRDEDAIEIIKSVKTLVDQIQFKPSNQKMFGITEKMLIEKLYDSEMIKNIPLKIEANMNMSPRAILEAVRSLGINHEAEVSEILNKDQKSAFKVPHNMKSILMKLEEAAQQKIVGKENLDHLTGQQLLNKLEVKSNKQKLMFQIPIEIEGKVQQLKVHVNTKKDQQKMDWKNARLYFVIHLENLGDTGVVVDVKKGQVNITIKNDHTDLEARMKPFVEENKVRLESVGFSDVQIKYQSLSGEQTTEAPIVTYEKEGFDVSI